MPSIPPPNSSSSSSSSETREPTLPLGDINLVVLTDVHSWVAGHGDNEGPNHLDANYGDVVSFFEQYQNYCWLQRLQQKACGDVWLVQNGDWIDGTGLSMDGDATNLIEVLKQIPFDVLNTGNHDLYQQKVIEETLQEGGYLDHWGPRHLSSNVYMNSSTSGSDLSNKQPMSNRYHVLKGETSTVLVFGFIYNMEDPSDLVVVQKVEAAVQEEWFQSVLQDASIGYNAILVMLHAGMDDPAVEILRSAIRNLTQDIDPNGNLPIQFVAGHTHLRRHTIVDSQSSVVEAGRYLDTVGWISFPNADTIRETKQRRDLQSESMQPVQTTNATTTIARTAVTDLFQHVFLDANRKTLREALGLGENDQFQTRLGLNVASFIQKTRDSMGLTQHIGCAPMDYLLNRSLEHEDSLWGLFRDQVGVHALATVDSPSNRALFLSQDSWRYGLYGGNHLTMDDIYAVSPFDEPIYRVSVLPCNSIRKLDRRMNADLSNVYLTQVPEWILSEYDEEDSPENCELYVNRFGLDRVQAGLHEMTQARGEADAEWNPIESNLTTTNIWIHFVQDQWQCPNDTNNNLLDWGSFQKSLESGNPPVAILVGAGVLLLIASLLVCFCCCRCCRRRKRTNGKDGYDGVMVDSSAAAAAVPSDDNYRDDEGGDYCDDDDDDENEEEPPIRIV